MMQALIAVGVDGRAVMLQHHDEGPHVGLWKDSETLDPVALQMDELPKRPGIYTWSGVQVIRDYNDAEFVDFVGEWADATHQQVRRFLDNKKVFT